MKLYRFVLSVYVVFTAILLIKIFTNIFRELKNRWSSSSKVSDSSIIPESQDSENQNELQSIHPVPTQCASENPLTKSISKEVWNEDVNLSGTGDSLPRSQTRANPSEEVDQSDFEPRNRTIESEKMSSPTGEEGLEDFGTQPGFLDIIPES